jgi:hypothetical protein
MVTLMPSFFRIFIALAACTAALPAAAQNAPVPKFEMAKPPTTEAAWTAQAKGSLLVTSGNSQSRNGVLALSGSRLAGKNKVSLDGQVAYGRSKVVIPVRDPMNPQLIVGLARQTDTTTNQWLIRGRDDYFFTANNAGYVLAQIGADPIAGKELHGGAQAGYSRQLWKDERHTAVAELGYDFSYESYKAQPGKVIDPVQIHSARLFLGEELKVSEDTGFKVGFEALFNLNKENALEERGLEPDPAPRKEVAAFKDTRLMAKAALSTKLWRNVSFAFGFTLKYDQNPAPRPLPSTAAGAMFAGTFFSDEVDTLTEATLVFTFL